MGRHIGPKHKLSRREGRDLFGVGGEALQRRLNQPPGGGGTRKGRRKESDYSRQLREKQKVKRIYGVRETQFLRFYRMAQRSSAMTGVALLQLLERRLDNVVYRLGFARTRPQARQFVNHGHVLVDGRRVDIPSFLVEPGQTVSLDPGIQQMPDVVELAEHRPGVPGWLELHDGAGHVLRPPERAEMEPDISEQLIVEYYSR